MTTPTSTAPTRTRTAAPPSLSGGVAGWSVAELREVWAAARATRAAYPPGAVCVTATTGGAGASTVALALGLALAGRGGALLVDPAPAARSGLLLAATAELGPEGSGWLRGRRDDLLLARPAGRAHPGVETLHRPEGGWLVVDHGTADLPPTRDVTVVVTRATATGAAAAEPHLATAAGCVTSDPGDDNPGYGRAGGGPGAVVVLVLVEHLPPRRRRLPALLPSTLTRRAPTVPLGRAGRALAAAGRVITVPYDPSLASTGITTAPLPAAVATAGAAIADLITPHTAADSASAAGSPTPGRPQRETTS